MTYLTQVNDCKITLDQASGLIEEQAESEKSLEIVFNLLKSFETPQSRDLYVINYKEIGLYPDKPLYRDATLAEPKVQDIKRIGDPNCLQGLVSLIRDPNTNTLVKILAYIAVFFLHLTVAGGIAYSSEHSRQQIEETFSHRNEEIKALKNEIQRLLTLSDEEFAAWQKSELTVATAVESLLDRKLEGNHPLLSGAKLQK